MTVSGLGKTPRISSSSSVRDTDIGEYVEIDERVRVDETKIGDYSYIMNDCEIIYTTIGRFCSIAAHVRINPGHHPLDRPALHHFTYRSQRFGFGPDDPSFFNTRRARPVTIGNDVWIGHGAVILPGVTIGDGAAVGANSIVSRDIPPFDVVAGNPARALRKRFSDAEIEALLRIEWWHWKHDQIHQAMDDFKGSDITRFIVKYDPDLTVQATG